MLSEIPSETMSDLLRERGFDPNFRKVMYVGTVGREHGLEATVRSMVNWPENVYFVLIGRCSTETERHYREIAADLGVHGRLIIAGPLDPELLWSVRAGADVFVNMYEPTCVNFTYTAGASNKRFEAMAVGVPQIVNQGEGMVEIFESCKAGVVVDPTNAPEIGKAIARLLDEQTASAASESARRAHMETFNYEAQFAPVLDRFSEWCLE